MAGGASRYELDDKETVAERLARVPDPILPKGRVWLRAMRAGGYVCDDVL